MAHQLVPPGIFLAFLSLATPAPAALLDTGPTLPQQIYPLLQRCVGCHSGDTPAGDLNLTTRALALKGGETGSALKPGDAAKSLMFTMVQSKTMPPKKPLAAAEVDALRRWIDGGADWDGVVKKAAVADGRAGPDWWSLQPVRRPEVPAVKNQEWVRTPLDAFILAELERRGFKPAPPADKTTLIRRLTYDLHGLPPTPAEIDAFLIDRAPDAYETLIDRLLASPRYGERWGRHWLDVARFAESNGFEQDELRDHAWRYRDYVIKSLNNDKPYPQFVREQLAGDTLTPLTPEGIVATGFLTAGPWDKVGNQVTASALLKLRVREEELEEILAAVGQTFLGLTINCARCHDHKFDPLAQRDYYRIQAAFAGVRYGDRPALPPDEAQRQEEVAARRRLKISDLEKQVATLEQAARAALQHEQSNWPVEKVSAPLARWTFEADARDTIGGMHGQLQEGAAVVGGRLRLNGKGAFLLTAPLPRAVKQKTLEAWVALADPTQRGGGVLTLETKDGKTFDALAYGERMPKRWLAGSELFHRTKNLPGPEEPARPGELIHVAIVYSADNRIAVYRNGVPYAEPYRPEGEQASLRAFAADESRVLLGLRHTGAANGFLAGEVAEARLYDRALSAEEIAASFKTGLSEPTPEQITARLSDEERRQRDGFLKQLETEHASLQTAPFVWAAVSRQPGPTHVLQRGDVEKKGDEVHAGPPALGQKRSDNFALPPDAPEGQRRLRFAEWVASADNPLTARVLVNRVWHHRFGQGIVASPNDFGYNGERPSHPELLDWLASEFVARGWSIKELHRLILRSATYRQSAAFDARAAEVDADNRLLWRFAPRRLEGEAVRDALLAVSGKLHDSDGGPSFRPFTVMVFNSTFYNLLDDDRPEFNRRTVYRINVNSARNPLLESFDCPDPSTKTPRRGVTTTPLQALGLMNNVFVLRAARAFAARVEKEAGGIAAQQVERAYRLALGRTPSAQEAERAAALTREHGLDQLCWVLLNASEFLYVR